MLVAILFALRASAQATFFQTPSGDITDPGDIYLQQQSTMTDRLDLTAQGMVGLAHHFDVGLSIYNFDLIHSGGRIQLDANDTERREPFGPLALATMQRRVDFAEGIGVLWGVQSGPNIASLDRMRIAVRSYSNLVVEFGASRRCSGGVYLANGIFVGGSSLQFGPWVGCDIEILDELLEIQADWDFGGHANGGATVGPQLRLGKHVGIAPAVRAPNPWAENAKWGAVLQFELKDPLG
jgi:hypothetical protein